SLKRKKKISEKIPLSRDRVLLRVQITSKTRIKINARGLLLSLRVRVVLNKARARGTTGREARVDRVRTGREARAEETNLDRSVRLLLPKLSLRKKKLKIKSVKPLKNFRVKEINPKLQNTEGTS